MAIGSVKCNPVPGISKAHGDNKGKASGELQIQLRRLATGRAVLKTKTLGVLPLNSNNLPILGVLPLNSNNLPILGALPPSNSNNLLIPGALPLNSNNLLIPGALLLSSNNLPIPGNQHLLLHLKIPGDNSKL